MDDNLKVDIIGLKSALKMMGINNLKVSHILGEVYFMLSLRCNLRCKVCAWWGIKGPCRDKNFLSKYCSVLTLKELKNFADEIVIFKPKLVNFSGGEPLYWEKWYPLAQYFHLKGVKVNLVTNGVLFLKNLKKITRVVDEINLSLGGPPSILPLIRENPVSHFRQILKGLKRLTEFKRQHLNRPRLRILYTISDLSYAHMEELIRFMVSQRIQIDHYKFQHLMFIDSETFKAQRMVLAKEFGIKNLDLWKGYTYSPQKINFSKFREELERLRHYNNVSFSPNLSGRDLESYYRNNRGALNYAQYCTAAWHQLNIMPNGSLYICHDYFLGNLKDEPFEKLWNGWRVKRLRYYLTKRLFPGCKGCFYHYCDRMEDGAY